MIRIAIVGTGGYAFELIKILWSLPEKYELIAATSNPKRKSPNAATCREKGVPVYDNVDELLENIAGKCNVIMVPTPIYTHASITKKCLENGFEVFMEKPPVATIQEYDDLLEHAKKAGNQVPVCFQLLYNPPIQEVKKRICNGDLGKVKRIKALSLWYRLDNYYNRTTWAGKCKLKPDWVLDGTINNPLAHVLANELYLACPEPGKMANPKTIRAELYRGHNLESEDTSSLRIITANDVEIIFNATLCAEEHENISIIVEAEKATVEYINFEKAVIRYNDGRKETVEDSCDNRRFMLEKLADSFEQNLPYTAPLEMLRPFTLSVNGAFESSAKIHPINNQHIKRYPLDDSTKTDIIGINKTMQKAHEQGKILSELSIPWAVKTKPFAVGDYKKFPTNFKITEGTK